MFYDIGNVTLKWLKKTRFYGSIDEVFHVLFQYCNLGKGIHKYTFAPRKRKVKSFENRRSLGQWKAISRNLLISYLLLYLNPCECPQMLDFTGFEGIFNLRGNYRNLS